MRRSSQSRAVQSQSAQCQPVSPPIRSHSGEHLLLESPEKLEWMSDYRSRLQRYGARQRYTAANLRSFSSGRLVGQWLFKMLDSTHVPDHSGNGHDGALLAPHVPAWTSARRTGWSWRKRPSPLVKKLPSTLRKALPYRAGPSAAVWAAALAMELLIEVRVLRYDAIAQPLSLLAATSLAAVGLLALTTRRMLRKPFHHKLAAAVVPPLASLAFLGFGPSLVIAPRTAGLPESVDVSGELGPSTSSHRYSWVDYGDGC